MNNLKKRRKSIILSLRNNIITGIDVLVRIGITLYITKFFIKISSKFIPKEFVSENGAMYIFPPKHGIDGGFAVRFKRDA